MIYDYLCSNLSYDYELLDKIIENSKTVGKHLRNPYLEVKDVLTKKKGVCNAIAQVYRILLELNGIYSLCVVCDNGMEVPHQLNLVYDKENNLYSFDDITSVLVGIAPRDSLFDYDYKYASSIDQGNKEIVGLGYWVFLLSSYLDFFIGRKSDFHKQFGIDDGVNNVLPNNIRSIKDKHIR